MIGDFLYKLSEKDQQSIGIDLLFAQVSQTGALANIDHYFIVPNDVCWSIQSANFYTAPGAAQHLNEIYMEVGVNNGGVIANPVTIFSSSQPRMDSVSGFPNNTNYTVSKEFENLLIGADKIVHMRAVFSAGAAANTFQGSLSGYAIPRGNITF